MVLKTRYIIDPIAREILEFWFDEKTEPKWWAKDKNFDQVIRDKYEITYQRARNGVYDNWVDIPEEILALIIVLDQFPRNMYRDSEKSFQSDSEALELS